MELLNIVQGINTAELTNMTEVQVGGGKSRGLLPTGTAFVRLSGYIEYGKQPQQFNGKPKDPAIEFRLVFTVVGGVGVNLKGEEENFVGEDGFLPTIATFDTTSSQYQKSAAVAYFNALNVAPKTATHFIQKIGQLYTLHIGTKKHKTKGTDVQDIDFKQLQPAINPIDRKPYAQYADKDGNAVTIPELKPENIQVFLWHRPESVSLEQYKAMWDSIHIAGEWEEKKDDSGKVISPKRSKNFIQEKCMSALDFEGSSLQQMIGGVRLPNITASATEEPEPEPTQPAPEETVAQGTEVAVPPADDEDDLQF